MPTSRKRPWLKILAILIGVTALAVIAVIGYFAIYFPLQANAGWKKSRAEFAAAGESLLLADFVPPPIPDADNFYADPLWMELTDRVPVEEESGFIKYVPRLAEKDRKFFPLNEPPSEAERKELEIGYPEFSPIAREKSRIAILLPLGKDQKKNGDPKRSAEFTLALLSRSEPVMTQIRQLTRRRGARFPLRYEDGMTIGFDHLTYVISAGRWFRLHARAFLALGRPDIACEDILDTLKLARLTTEDPLVLPQLVATAVWDDGLDGIHHGLENHSWSETDLDQFQKGLEGVDFYADMARALRMERASFLHWIETVVAKGKLPAAKGSRNLVIPIYRTYCLPGDLTLYCRVIQAWIDTLEHRPAQGLNEKSCPEPLMEYLAAHPTLLDTYRIVLSKLALPGLSGTIGKATRAQTRTLQAQTAIALERFYLKNGTYPESLESLVPEFLAAVPLDPTTLRPLIYKRESPNRFRLWSVGWNAVDDNGAVERSSAKGDWVWGK